MSARAKSKRFTPCWSPIADPTNSPSPWKRCPPSPARPITSWSSTTTFPMIPTSGCTTWWPASPSQPPISGRAETWVAQVVSRWACCTRWRSAPTGCGWPTTTDVRKTPACSPPCWHVRTSTRSPRCRRWSATWVTHNGWPSRCAGDFSGGGGSTNFGARRQTKTCCRASHRCSTARCSAPKRWKRSAFPTCACSSAAMKPSCTEGWSARGCRSVPA